MIPTRSRLLPALIWPLLLILSVSQAGAAVEAGALRLLEDLQSVITDLAERVKPSVVSVLPTQPNRSANPRERMPSTPGSGSGVIVDQEGHIITNNHVVGDATEVEVRLSDKTRFTAQVIGKDPDTDLALLKITTDRPLPFATFGDSGTVRVGQWVLAVGNPFGLDRTVTLGVVSGIGRENMNLSKYENFIQTDASINPGNSGGPLFNMRGDVIGINTAIINYAQGIGFAIPSNMAKQVMHQLLTRGKVVRAWLGVGIQPVTAELATKFGVNENEGVLVNEVFENDPASRAGIKPGDIITKVDGKVVDTPNSLSRLIAALEPGSATNVEVVRDGKRHIISVGLSERKEAPVVASVPPSRSEIKLGLDVQDLTAELAEKFKLKETKGVLISKVDRGSMAMVEGLREGDLIKEVNRTEVGSVGEFSAAVAKVKRGETILLRVLRENRAFYVVLKTTEK
ncbi:Do family serine endopeptidase [Candidatus Nitrospira bockiana]